MNRVVVLVMAGSIAGCLYRYHAWEEHRYHFRPSALPIPTAATEYLRSTTGHLCWPSAHRGNIGGSSDNSLIALAKVARAGISLAEVDVRGSPEGTLFLFHDHRIRGHNTRNPGQFIGRSISKLHDAERNTLRLRDCASSSIPTLKEALQSIRGTSLTLQLDIKNESIDRIMAIGTLVESLDAGKQVMMQLHPVALLRLAREHFPEIGIVWIPATRQELAEGLPYHPEIIQPHWIDRRFNQRVHAAGSRLLLNILNPNGDRMSAWPNWYSQGFDILLTDAAKDLQGALLRFGCPDIAQ